MFVNVLCMFINILFINVPIHKHLSVYYWGCLRSLQENSHFSLLCMLAYLCSCTNRVRAKPAVSNQPHHTVVCHVVGAPFLRVKEGW